MNPYLNWGQLRADALLAEAQERRLAQEAQRHVRPRPFWSVLRLLWPARRPRLT